MLLRNIAISTLLVTGVLMAQSPSSPTTLDQVRDRYRPLLIFAPSPDDPALLAQRRMLRDVAASLTSRDVILVLIPYSAPASSEISLTPEAAVAARRRFHVTPPDFTVILIGKDGGEKFRSTRPVSFKQLQETIDSMPMRQQEMANPARR